MARTALVIGGTGFLGGGIAGELRDAGWDVTNLGRGQKAADPAVPFIQADRATPGELARATPGQSFDLVVDCAAYNDAHAADAVAAFAGRVGHYVFISTDFVYAAIPDAHYPIREEAPKQPALPYAGGKLAAEAVLARSWADQRFPATTLRPPHILGTGKPLGSDPLAMRDPQLARRIRDGEPIRLLADGQMLIQPVWNREVGRCVAQIAGNKVTFGGIFNCAGADCVTALRYYEIVAELVGATLRVESVPIEEFRKNYPDKAHMARHRIYDLSKLRECTGYKPTLSLTDAIRETLAGTE